MYAARGHSQCNCNSCGKRRVALRRISSLTVRRIVDDVKATGSIQVAGQESGAGANKEGLWSSP